MTTNFDTHPRDHFTSVPWKGHEADFPRVSQSKCLGIEGCEECELCLMMEEIHEAWQSGSNEACDILWSLQDGYGEPGFMPGQGYDWSGIRDSSDEAIRAMFQAIHA